MQTSMDRSYSLNENNRNNCENVHTPRVETKNDNFGEEELRCFVCDDKIQGRHYALATCKTQNSKSKVIEKLGELVGERYMVVISEDDVICRTCANLINTLDKLETEMLNVRVNVLRFLERKYSLQEGEFLENSKNVKRSQPPQITKSSDKDCRVRKRTSSSISSAPVKDVHKERNLWMRCNKCHYTALCKTFMARHVNDLEIRNHDEKKQRANKQEDISLKARAENVTDTSTQKDKTELENVSLIPFPICSEGQLSNENTPLIKADSDRTYLHSLLASGDGPSFGQPFYVRVLPPLDANEESTADSTMLPTSTSSSELMIKLKDNSTKQILTLTEDGDLEMMEITWNDVHSLEPDSRIMFQ